MTIDEAIKIHQIIIKSLPVTLAEREKDALKLQPWSNSSLREGNA